MNHPIWPFPVLIAEGSATVFINGKPAARLHSKMVCGSFTGKEIYMMNLDNPKVVMPSGNERGANPLWRPGGLPHPGGMREAVLDKVTIPHDINFLLANPDVVRIQ